MQRPLVFLNLLVVCNYIVESLCYSFDVNNLDIIKVIAKRLAYSFCISTCSVV